MRKGSITIFGTLVMVLVVSVLFVLLEGARIQELKRLSQLQTELALESVFANYNTNLWEEYRILVSDSTCIEEEILRYAEGRNGASDHGLNLLQAGIEDVSVTQLTLLTDGGGAVYTENVSNLMKETIGYGMAKELFNQYEVIRDVKETSDWDKGWIETGLLQELEQNETNPMLDACLLEDLGILELVLPIAEGLSHNVIQTEDLVSNRTLETGISPCVRETDWLDRILMQQYILKYMSNYFSANEERGLAYEAEYVIGGKASDLENLKAVIEQILGIREVTNFLYLTTDEVKCSEALILATLLAGVSANPVVIETVKIALLTAWAFGESVLDVRALLQGKKVPLLKSIDTWTLSLNNVGKVADKNFMAKESEWGLSYKDYLGVLLLMEQEQKVAYRSMDVQEQTVRKQSMDNTFCLDHYLVQTEIEMVYAYHPIFSTGLPWNQSIKTKATYRYN